MTHTRFPQVGAGEPCRSSVGHTVGAMCGENHDRNHPRMHRILRSTQSKEFATEIPQSGCVCGSLILFSAFLEEPIMNVFPVLSALFWIAIAASRGLTSKTAVADKSGYVTKGGTVAFDDDVSDPSAADKDDAAAAGARAVSIREFSGSCAELSYMSEAQRKALTEGASEGELERFCHPEEPFECSDYGSSIAHWGSLQTNDDGFWCRFVPSRK